MYKQGKYTETDKMSDLICENYPMAVSYTHLDVYKRQKLIIGINNICKNCFL